MTFFKSYITILICLVIVDITWLGFIAEPLYKQDIGGLMRKPSLLPVIIVYLALALGVTLFALPKADSLSNAFVWGALFGVSLYGVYDFTNYAILANWPLRITLIDFVWGMVLCGLANMAGYWIKGVF
jgi:uncharacterized membrane protein